jgi:hypothetical protein
MIDRHALVVLFGPFVRSLLTKKHRFLEACWITLGEKVEEIVVGGMARHKV